MLGVYPGVVGALLLALLLAVHVCSMCNGEGAEIEGLVSILSTVCCFGVIINIYYMIVLCELGLYVEAVHCL